MRDSELPAILEFLRGAERLKSVTRQSWTSTGRRESVAEHTWRVALMCIVLRREFPDVDLARVLMMIIVHDLGEGINGDIPAPAQTGQPSKADQERRDLQEMLGPLPEEIRIELAELWEEYEGASTPEAKLAKALDKLETILQHNQGQVPADFDYRFNLEYGRRYTAADPRIAAIRALLDLDTEARAAELERR